MDVRSYLYYQFCGESTYSVVSPENVVVKNRMQNNSFE